jgi:hypothetical protein
MDLGPCPKIHNEKVAAAFKADREKNPSDPRFGAFEQEYQNNIYAFVEDCDRKIRASQRRLEKTPEENAKGVNLVRDGSGVLAVDKGELGVYRDVFHSPRR